MADTTYSDITDFSNGSMNGWEVSDFVGDKARIVQEASEGCVLDFPTLKEKADGIVLSKQYDGLASGKYQFVMRARSVSKSSPARISVVGADAKGGKFVIYETNLWQHNEDRWGITMAPLSLSRQAANFLLKYIIIILSYKGMITDFLNLSFGQRLILRTLKRVKIKSA